MFNQMVKAPNGLVDRPPIVQFTPNVFGFPDRLLTRLRYHDIYDLTATSGVISQQVYRWNSTFDPDLTNVGHQPMYRDTYAAVYDQYAVVNAWAIVTLSNKSTTDTVMVNVVIDDDSTPGASANILAEQNHGQTAVLTPLSGSHSQHVFRIAWNCQEILNIDPYASETYKTAVGNNPTEQSTLAISIAPVGAVTTIVTMDIQLVQEVLWTELTTPSLS